jgi:hypothetical protein
LIKDLNGRPETLKQENVGETLEDVNIGNDFLNGSGNKSKVRQMGLHQILYIYYHFSPKSQIHLPKERV